MATDPMEIEARRKSSSSPWNKAATEENRTAMPSEIWPALGEAKIKPPEVAAAPAPNTQGSTGLRKTDGYGSGNLANKHHHSHKSSAKRSTPANNMPTFPIPLPYHNLPGQPPMLYPVVPPLPPPPPLMVTEYGYPASFPSEAHIIKPGFEPPIPPFIPAGQGTRVDANRNYQSPRRDLSMWHPNASHHGNRPQNGHETDQYFNQPWRHQRPYGPRENMNVPHGIRSGPFIRPIPQFFPPAPGYIRPGFPGPAQMYLVPAPPDLMRPHPHYVSHPPHPPYPLTQENLAHPHPSQETLSLMANIVKQIEYYFSDENLQKDHFLLSLLDERGWVSVHKIADFNRVKKMTTDIRFIVDALQSSKTIEVQDDHIRRRNDWSKWVQASSHLSTPNSQSAKDQMSVNIESIGVNCHESDDSKTLHKEHVKLSSSSDGSKAEANGSLELSVVKFGLGAAEPLKCNGENDDNCNNFASEPISKNKLNSGCNSISEEVSTDGRFANRNSSTSDSLTCESLDGKGEVSNPANSEITSVKTQSDGSGHLKSFVGLSNGSVEECPSFTEEPSTFLLDEELDLEHSSAGKDHHLSNTRINDDDDDGTDVNDHDMQRLVIVTQGTKMDGNDRSFSEEPDSMSHEEASAISEALYYFEQQCEDKRTNSQRSNSRADSRSLSREESRGEKISKQPGLSSSSILSTTMATSLLFFPSTPTFSLHNRNPKKPPLSFSPLLSLPNPTSFSTLSALPSKRPLPPVAVATAEVVVEKEEEEEEEGLLEISKLGISEQIVSALSRRGITQLFPIQRAVLEPAMEGRDMIGRAITGSGKTLAFGIPILDKIIRHQSQHRKKRAPSALVLAPTRELARQVQQEFKVSAPNLSSTCLYGGTSIPNQVRTLGFGMDIVVGTPGRIIDLVERGALDLSAVKFVVLDEADQMLAVGFQEAVECILGYLPAKKQCMLFSATMPSWVNNISRKYLSDPIVVDLVGDSDQKLADGISLYSVASAHANKQNILSTLITKFAQGGKSIIFTRTKKDAESLSRSMSSIIGSKALHGNMQQMQRDRTLSAFREGRFNVLVATDVAARGLDIPNVDLVIHYEMPNSSDFFVHRSGRTGRAGKKGTAILMFTESQRRTVRSMERELGFRFEELRGITGTGSFGSGRQVEDSLYESDDEIVTWKSGRSDFSYDRPSGNYGRPRGSNTSRNGESSFSYDRPSGNFGRPRGSNTSRYSEGNFRGKSSYGSRVSDTRRTQKPKYGDYFDNERSNSERSPRLYDNRWSDSQQSPRLYGNERSNSQQSPRHGGWAGRSNSSNGTYGDQRNQQKGMKQRSASKSSDFDFDELLDLFKD